MIPSGIHLHTTYGDGADSPEEMILAAIGLGFVSVGISEHAWAPYDDAAIPEQKMGDYRRELLALKEKYAGKIEVYMGLEVDAFHLHDKADWDYVIGSVHFVRGKGGRVHTVDHNEERLMAGIRDAGSVEAMVRSYAESVVYLAETYRPDILGHIDVVAKLNEQGRYFDEGSDWYLSMWESLIPRIAAAGCIVELNSGAVARGYRQYPYPAPPLLRMLHGCGVPVIVSSDAHARENTAFGYEAMAAAVREAGYRSLKILKGGAFVDYELL